MASQDTTFDLTVIGSGPGGYVGAIRAAQLGLKTACVEMAPLLGGTCLIWGCIPTKALLHTAEVLETSRHAGDFGVVVAPGAVDVPAMQKYKDKVVLANAKGVEYLFKKNNVTLVRGRGTLLGQGKIQVEEGGAKRVFESKSIVPAVVTTPKSPACRDVSRTSAECRSALVGMHPQIRHVPPRRGAISTHAVLRPSWAARMAPT